MTKVDGTTTSWHATHVGGTIGASGAHAPAEGMAIDVNIRSYDWNSDFTEMGSDAALVDVSNHSYGIVTGWTIRDADDFGYPSGDCDVWLEDLFLYTEDVNFGKYDSLARQLDTVLHDHSDLLSVWSAGNDRNDVFTNAYGTGEYIAYLSGNPGIGGWTGPGWYLLRNAAPTIAPGSDGNNGTGYDCLSNTKNAKNSVVVGAIHDITTEIGISGAISATSFSSYGPTDDGRIKPDVVGNGASLTSAHNASDTAYASSSGTSMSSPNVAGTAVLLVEHFEDEWFSCPRSATTKGVMIHTATDDPNNAGPDYAYGWGLVDAAEAATFITDSFNSANQAFLEEREYGGSAWTKDFVSSGTEPLKATIVWTDPEGASHGGGLDIPTPVLVNDLDLWITGPGGTYYPWTLNPASPTDPAVRTTANHVDNVEQVLIDAPASGTYTVHVGDTGGVALQDYTLLISGAAVPTTVVGLDPGNNLTISGSDLRENLTVSVVDVSGTRHARVKDSSRQISAGNGANQVDPYTVDVVLSTVTGGNILVDAQGGDDTLTIDFGGSGGNFAAPITGIRFDGGETLEVGGDDLVLQGGGAFASATYNFNNVSGGDPDNGTIDVTGNPRITFTGLESVSSIITATDVTINLPAGADNAQLSDIGGGLLRIESTDVPATFEVTDFTAPTGTLTVNGGAGDTVTVSTALTMSYDLDITAEDANFNAALDLGGNTLTVDVTGTSSTAAGALAVTGGTIIKDGTGTFEISGQMTGTGFTGTVNAGTLAVTNAANSLDVATSSFTVNSGAELFAGLSATAFALGDADVNLDDGTLTVLSGGGPIPDLGGVTGGLMYWLDASDIDADGLTNDNPANGSPVGTWQDKTANNRDFTQGTANQQPVYETAAIGGLPALHFDGSNDRLDFGTTTQPKTFIAVLNADTGGGLRGPWGSLNADKGVRLNDNNWYRSAGHNADNNDFNGGIVGNVRVNGVATGAYTVGTPHVLTEVRGFSTTTFPVTSVGGYFGGRMWHAEIAVYDRVLSEAERLAVEVYIGAKYGIAVSGAGIISSLANDVSVTGSSQINLGTGLASVEFNSLTADPAATLTADGSGKLGFASGVFNGTATVDVDGGIGLEFGSLALNGDAAFDTGTSEVTVSNISETSASGLSVSGGGTLVLPTSNSYTGTTTVTGSATLEIRNNGALGGTGGGTIVNSGASLRLENGGNLSVAEPLSIHGGGNSNSRGALHVVGADVDYNGAVTLAGNATIRKEGGGTLEFRGGASGGINTGSSEVRFETVATVRVYDNGITGSGSVRKEENGTLEMRTNSSSYTGNTLIANGVIDVNQSNGLGTAAGGTTVNGGGTLRTRGNITLADNLVLNNGNGEGNQGVLRVDDNTTILTGSITLNNTPRIDVDGGEVLIINGVVGGNSLSKVDSGTLELNSNNIYTGATTSAAGLLRVGHSNGLGTTAGATTLSSGTLELVGGSSGITVAENLTLPVGGGVSGAGTLVSNADAGITNQLTGTISLAVGPVPDEFEITVPTGNLTITGGGSPLDLGENTSLLVNGTGDVEISANITGDADNNVADYAQLVNSLDPKAYWRFEETTGTDAANSATGASSLLAAGDGTYRAGISIGQAGVLGNAVDVSGNRYVETVSFDSLGVYNSEFTMVAWFNRADGSGSDRMVFGNDNPGPSSHHRMHSGFRGNQLTMRFWSNDLQGGPVLNNIVDEWHHVTFRLNADGSNWRKRIFYDGNSVATNTNANPFLEQNFPLLIGRAVGGRNFVGGIDEVAVFDGALTDAQIASLAVIEAPNNVTKNGNGTLTPSGTNDYNGATDVQAGGLLVNGTHTGGDDYTVAGGATLGGTGSTDAAAESGGTVGAGSPTSTVDSLDTGDLTLTGGTFQAQIGADTGTTPGTSNDVVNITGTVDLGAGVAALDVTSLGNTPAVGSGVYTLISNDNTDPTTGNFTGLSDGDIVTVGGNHYLIFYNGGDGNDVVLRVIGFVEVDQFATTTASILLVGGPIGATPVEHRLTGPAMAEVLFEGPLEGDALDHDGNGLDEVVTELVSLDLSNADGFRLTLNPNQMTFGQIEEQLNNNPGRLDLDPFHPGDADSFFDVYFQIEVPGGLVLHNNDPLRIETDIRHKPPFERYRHIVPMGGPIELFDENDNPTGVFLIDADHFTGPVAADVFVDGTGDLIIREPGGDTDDTLTISVIDDGTKKVRVHDPNHGLRAGAGAIQVNAHTVDVVLSTITGEVVVDTLGGDDTLTIGFGGSGGDFVAPITGIRFDGGETLESVGDTLKLQGGGMFGSSIHNFNNVSGGDTYNGTIDVTGNPRITFAGIEPVSSIITAMDVTINLPAGADNAQLSDIGGGQLRIESTDVPATFEVTNFTAPTDTLTINGGAGDTVTVSTSLTMSYDLDITAEDANFNAALDLGGNTLTVDVTGTAGTAAGALSVTGGTIIKDGTGTFEISGQMTGTGFTGTVNAGTLTLSNTANSLDAATSSFTVNSGAELIGHVSATAFALGDADIDLDGGELTVKDPSSPGPFELGDTSFHGASGPWGMPVLSATTMSTTSTLSMVGEPTSGEPRTSSTTRGFLSRAMARS